MPWGGLEPPSPADRADVLILDDRGMVWIVGVEPTRPKAQTPQACAAANYAISTWSAPCQIRTDTDMILSHVPLRWAKGA